MDEKLEMLKVPRSSLLSYGAAVLAVVLTLGLKLLFGSEIGRDTPFLIFFVAVMFSAWYGGMGPGLLATVIIAIVAYFFFLSSPYSLTLDAKGLLQVGIFALEGIGVSALVSSLHDARRRAETSAKIAAQHQAILYRSQKDFRLLVENVGDYAILMIDQGGRIESWGLGAESIFGYKDAEIIGQPFSRLFTPEDVESGVPEREMKRAEAEGRTEDDRWHQRRDGARFWASGITTALRDEAGNLRGFSKVARDITVSKRVQETLSVSEERYRILAETARDAIITIDSDSRILFVNQAAEKIFGHHIAEMQGASLTMLMPDYLQHLHRAGVERYIKTGQRHVSWESVEVPGLRKNGLEIPLEISFGEYNQEGKRYFTGVCRDISERKRVQSRLATQHAVTKVLAEAHEVAEAMPKIIQAICESLQWDIGELWRVDPDDNSLRCVDAWHDPSVGDEVYAGMRSEQPLHAGGGLPGRVWSSGDPIWIPDVSREQNFPHARAAADASLRSAFAFPIMLGAKIVGVMEFFSRDVKERDEEIIEMISALGNQFGQFLERKLIEREKAQLLAREQEARAEAENANRLKDEFLATLSHELRTPLTAIIGWSNILIAGGMEEADAARALETIYRNARAQNQLIDDLLEVSRIVTGKLRLDVQPVDLAGVIVAAIDAARPAAEAKNIRLQTLLDSQASSVSGDPDRLQQVVWNLVSNAVKFTPKGGRVQIKLERVNSHIEITVADTGAGIKPEFLPYVFDRFRQSDATITRTHGGLGLGLSIVRQLVELHGGTVRAESDGEGHGATFIVSLPFIATRQDKPMMERVHPSTNLGNISFECPPQLVGLRVLIVDDESDTRDLLRAIMERCGCEVTTLGTAAEALAALQQTNPDVLISDIGMPEEDGYTFIRKVRALPTDRGGGTPAIALTAYARAEDRVRALRSGFQVHVPKPVEPMELAAVVASLTRRNGQR